MDYIERIFIAMAVTGFATLCAVLIWLWLS
jgi:hypothetical protein